MRPRYHLPSSLTNPFLGFLVHFGDVSARLSCEAHKEGGPNPTHAYVHRFHKYLVFSSAEVSVLLVRGLVWLLAHLELISRINHHPPFPLYQFQSIPSQVCISLHDALQAFIMSKLFRKGFCSRSDDERSSHLEECVIVKAWPKILLEKCLIITC